MICHGCGVGALPTCCSLRLIHAPHCSQGFCVCLSLAFKNKQLCVFVHTHTLPEKYIFWFCFELSVSGFREVSTPLSPRFSTLHVTVQCLHHSLHPRVSPPCSLLCSGHSPRLCPEGAAVSPLSSLRTNAHVLLAARSVVGLWLYPRWQQGPWYQLL